MLRAGAVDGNNNYVAYVFGPFLPGFYLATPGDNHLPDTPQNQITIMFVDLGTVDQFDLHPPLDPTGSGPDYPNCCI